jgi:hypothetical protein
VGAGRRDSALACARRLGAPRYAKVLKVRQGLYYNYVQNCEIFYEGVEQGVRKRSLKNKIKIVSL